MATYLPRGDEAIVRAGPLNNGCDKPGLGDRLLSKIYEFDTVEVTTGPKFADGMVWWKVNSLNPSLDGWMAEASAGITG